MSDLPVSTLFDEEPPEWRIESSNHPTNPGFPPVAPPKEGS